MPSSTSAGLISSTADAYLPPEMINQIANILEEKIDEVDKDSNSKKIESDVSVISKSSTTSLRYM